MRLLMRLVINTLSLLVVSYVVPGFLIVNIWTAVVAAVVIGTINTFIKPILQLIALPITILTFGLAAFLINVGLLYLASFIVPGFEISGFMTAILASFALTFVSWFLNKIARN